MIVTVFFGMSFVVWILKLLPGAPNSEYGAFQVSQNELPWNQTLFSFWNNYLSGNWGHSLISPDVLVLDIIKRESYYSFLVGGTAFVCSLLIGVGITFCVLWNAKSKKSIQVIQFLGTFFLSMPAFLTAPLFIFIFSIYWKILPSALWKGPISLILPVLVLSLKPIFFIFKLFTEKMLEVERKDFIKTAVAKGVPIWRIMILHQGKNAITVVASYISSLAGYLVSSSFVVETFFALPGWGSLFVRVVSERDYTVILGLCFTLTLIVQSFQIISDFLVYKLNPTLTENYN